MGTGRIGARMQLAAVFLIFFGSLAASTVSSGAARNPLQYRMTIHMDQGNVVIQLFPDAAPHTVARVVELIQKKFYDGLTFHRVEPGSVVQGGDPQGDGSGGSGTKLKAEFNSKHHVTGTVSMARSSAPDSADSQFFICLSPLPYLDGKYTVIGQVISGMEVVRKIGKGDMMRRVTVR